MRRLAVQIDKAEANDGTAMSLRPRYNFNASKESDGMTAGYLTSFLWDAAGRLSAIARDGFQTKYAYDGL